MKNETHFNISGFSYDPTTGAIYKNNRRRDRTDSPYRRVNENKVRIVAHRLAWRLSHGRWPENFIDHINGDKHDNRIANLREATNSENQFNKRTQGIERGVSFDSTHSRWVVTLRKNGVLYCGASKTRLSAILAARLIRRTLHGEFAYQEAAA